MKTSSIYKKLENKKGIIVFSDPGGAKACLSIASKLSEENITLVSDRDYDFYQDFGLEIEVSSCKDVKVFFEKLQPDFILTGTSMPEKIEISFLREAKERKLYSISFIDHWTHIKERFYSQNEYVFPYEMWLIDQEAKQKALSLNMRVESIKVIGNPYFSYLKDWSPNSQREELLKNLNLTDFTRYILYAPQPLTTFNLQEKYGFDELSGLKYISKAIKENNLYDICILVKGHPNQNDEIFMNFIKNESVPIKYVKDVDINHLIYYSELVLGYFSNSLIEASAMNKNVIRILIDLKDPMLDPLQNKEIGQQVANYRELVIELNKLKLYL